MRAQGRANRKTAGASFPERMGKQRRLACLKVNLFNTELILSQVVNVDDQALNR
jgi:hypothetical protein